MLINICKNIYLQYVTSTPQIWYIKISKKWIAYDKKLKNNKFCLLLNVKIIIILIS
jgi:hypothetical protein